MKAFEAFSYPEGETRFYDTVGVNEFWLDENEVYHAKMQVGDQHRNGFGNCQGGAIFSLCDMAGAAWARRCWKPSVTLDGSIQYLSAGKMGSTLTATVKPRKVGKKTAVILIEVYDENDRHVADCLFTVLAND